MTSVPAIARNVLGVPPPVDIIHRGARSWYEFPRPVRSALAVTTSPLPSQKLPNYHPHSCPGGTGTATIRRVPLLEVQCQPSSLLEHLYSCQRRSSSFELVKSN